MLAKSPRDGLKWEDAVYSCAKIIRCWAGLALATLTTTVISADLKPSDAAKATRTLAVTPPKAVSADQDAAAVRHYFPNLSDKRAQDRSRELTSIRPNIQEYEYRWTCNNVEWDRYCAVDESISIDAAYPGFQYCSHTEEVLHFNPSQSSDISRAVYLWSAGEVTLNTNSSIRFNHLYEKARTQGSGLLLDRTGGDFDFKIHLKIIPASFSNEWRELFGCKARFQVPSPGAPGQRHACACVYRGDASNVQRCLSGSPLCDRLKLSTDTNLLRCVADESSCDNALQGGTCPWDISPNFQKVSVPSSPYCN